MKESRGTQMGWVVGALVIVIYTLLPIAWIVSLSFKAGDDLFNKHFWPSHWSLENYRTVFSTDLFVSALRNSIGISAIATTKVRIVLAEYITDGPTIMRTAFRSLVARDIRSPVRRAW